MGLLACHHETPKRYELEGKVVSVDRDLKRVTIAHREIPGYMAAMTMPFALKENWAYAVLNPGDQIKATLVVVRERSWLEDVIITHEGTPEQSGTITSQAEPKIGDQVPDFFLTNQDGKKLHLNQYRGKSLVVTFIYTRCPLPDYCPLMIKNFAELDEALRRAPALAGRTHLLTISFDPEYDTPPILRSYGEKYAKSFDRWEFASAPAADVKTIAQYFGLRYWSEADQIVHSLRTAIIGPDGKLAKLYRGSEWKAEEAFRDLQDLSPAVPGSE